MKIFVALFVILIVMTGQAEATRDKGDHKDHVKRHEKTCKPTVTPTMAITPTLEISPTAGVSATPTQEVKEVVIPLAPPETGRGL